MTSKQLNVVIFIVLIIHFQSYGAFGTLPHLSHCWPLKLVISPMATIMQLGQSMLKLSEKLLMQGPLWLEYLARDGLEVASRENFLEK